LTRTFRAAGIETILALPKEAETDNLAPFLGLAFRTMLDAFDT
jgi:hypothetical protein